MRYRTGLGLFALILFLFMSIGHAPIGFSEGTANPEIIIPAMPIIWGSFYPEDLGAVSASSAVVFAEIESGACCDLLEDRLRVTISECTAPSGTGFKTADTGVEYVSDFRVGSTEYRSGIKVDISDVGCTLPIDGTPIDVTVVAESRTPLGGVSIGVINWSFFATGSRSTSPPPRANEPAPFELSSVNPRPLVPGQTRLISGRGLTSSTQVLFNTEIVENTSFNSSTSNITFLVPEGIDCGDHSVQLKNPGGEREYSNVMTFNITQNCGPPTYRIILPPPDFGDDPDPELNIESLFPNNGGPGTVVIVNGTGFLDVKSHVRFDDEVQTTDFIETTQLRFTIPQGAYCGNTDVFVRNDLLFDEDSNVLQFNVTGNCVQEGSSNPPSPPNEDPPPPVNDPPPGNNPPPSSPPPPANADEVEEFDTDNDCEISNTEFFGAVDSWLSGSLDNSLFFAVLDAWVSESNVCSATASTTSLIELKVSQTRWNSITFSTALHELSSLSISIYDGSGKLIHRDSTQGRSLSWNINSVAGSPVPNGVYFYRVEGITAMGSHVVAPIGKLVVLR